MECLKTLCHVGVTNLKAWFISSRQNGAVIDYISKAYNLSHVIASRPVIDLLIIRMLCGESWVVQCHHLDKSDHLVLMIIGLKYFWTLISSVITHLFSRALQVYSLQYISIYPADRYSIGQISYQEVRVVCNIFNLFNFKLGRHEHYSGELGLLPSLSCIANNSQLKWDEFANPPKPGSVGNGVAMGKFCLMAWFRSFWNESQSLRLGELSDKWVDQGNWIGKSRGETAILSQTPFTWGERNEWNEMSEMYGK
jgi:hypothetical protein